MGYSVRDIESGQSLNGPLEIDREPVEELAPTGTQIDGQIMLRKETHSNQIYIKFEA